ncbi:MAG: peptidyl-prolyl cis-trans isomerase [Clostridiales bacterium]|nr:peptidyl-prolyl cis-trans isomerase [Clostridiales bacterium]
MLKRIFVVILTFALTACMLLGCSFFSHDDARDMQQEIAVVKSYTITNVVLDDDGVGKTYEYKTDKKIIYKRDLLEYVNSNASSLASSFSGDAEGMYKYCVRMLISIELVANEVDALIDSNQVEWGLSQQNEIRRDIYSIIDNTLLSLKNNILSERDQEQIIEIDADTSSSSTTYPVKPDATDSADADEPTEPETTVWTPDRVSWPGVSGDSDARSLEREAMSRFLALIKSRVEDDFRLDKPARKWLKNKINAEIKAIDKLIDTQGIEAVYPKIGEYSYPMNESTSEFGYIMYYLSGENLERSQKITAMQEHLTDRVTVQYDEVEKSYNTLLNDQLSRFDADISEYDSAMSGGSTTVLYHANNNYFYVKHILLPFSDEQTAALTAFQNRPDIKNLSDSEKKEKVELFREQLVESITCYPHVDGEDDLSSPMTVDDVMSHVRSVMTPLAGNVQRANDAFNDLIYLYNTDPGAFGNDKGYVVKYELDEGESETYMQEFADAAREMRRSIEVGQVYAQPVITDYGVHIMYLSSVTQKGIVGLNDVTSPNGSQTYYDLLEEPIKTNRENASYTNWSNNVFTYNYKKHSKTYTDNFKNLWED